MEKETFEVFIYDTKLELDEEDDPTDAIVYFYPGDRSVQYQLSLCGSLITLLKRLKGFLGSAPELIKCKGKKFTIVEIGKYAVFLGVDGNCISNIAASTLCSFLVDNILFYFSSVQNFVTEHNTANKCDTDSLIRCILEQEWTLQEFNVIPFQKMTELPQYTKLKLNKLMEFCCLHSGILSSCLMFRERILSSQMGSVVTSMIVNEFTINREIGTVQISEDFSGRFIPVYISEKVYKRIVEKEKHKRYAADWKPCFLSSWNCRSDSIEKHISNEVRNGMCTDKSNELIASEQKYVTSELNTEFQNFEIMDETVDSKSLVSISADSGCHSASDPCSTSHDTHGKTYQDQSQHKDLGKYNAQTCFAKLSDSKTQSPIQKISQGIQQSETELISGEELSLFVCSDGYLSLIFLMEKYVERRSEKRVQNIVRKCLRDLEMISSVVIKCKENTEDFLHLEEYQFLQYTGGTCRIQENCLQNDSASIKTGVIKFQDHFYRCPYLDDVTVQSPHSIFYGKKAFSKTTYLSAGLNDNMTYIGMPPCSNDPGLDFGKTISEALLKNNDIKLL